MVRLIIQQKGDAVEYKRLSFLDVGSLTTPIEGKKMSVLSFSIPNGGTPLMKFNENVYTVSLYWNGFHSTVYITQENRGSGQLIYELQHLVKNINNALLNAFNNLDTLSGHTLPVGSEPPRVIIEEKNYLAVIGKTTIYDSSLPNPIEFFMNSSTFSILQSIDIKSYNVTSADFRFKCNFYNIPENIYLTNYIKNSQNALSISNYAYMRALVMTSTLPCESEIICSQTSSSSQASLNIISDYLINYDEGIKQILSSNDFSTPSDPYRIIKMTKRPITDVRFNVFYLTIEGTYEQFEIPPNTLAFIKIEIND